MVTLMMTRAHVFVSGKVHGVFFRAETRYEARRRNVKGWIRNLPDWRVEAIFEGEQENVKMMIEFCKYGPPAAKVTNVDVIWESYSGEFKDFEMKY
jgi:acylphosphatase